MIIGIGNDIIEISRVKKACEKEAFLVRNFTEDEIKLCKKTPFRYADNFAVKEAVAKCFGTGFRGFGLIDIEVLRDELGKPYVNLYNGAKDKAEALNIKQIHISISNTDDYSAAVAIAQGGLND